MFLTLVFHQNGFGQKLHYGSYSFWLDHNSGISIIINKDSTYKYIYRGPHGNSASCSGNWKTKGRFIYFSACPLNLPYCTPLGEKWKIKRNKLCCTERKGWCVELEE